MNKYSILIFCFGLFNFHAYAEKIIPGWEWHPSAEFPTPKDACLYAISQNPDKEWQYYDYIDDPYAGHAMSKMCRATHPSSGNEVREYTFVWQLPCPTTPQYVVRLEPSGIKSCNRYTISISGPAHTQALPSLTGPVKMKIAINSDDGPVKNWAGLYVQETGALGPALGLTDESGSFQYTYVPPFFIGANVVLNMTCEACENTATHTIEVSPTDISQPNQPSHPNDPGPDMCRR